jgi:carboxyl-terminal processing protease
MQGFPMTDGSVIMMVVGHILTPCGRVVQRQYRDVRVNDYYRMARAARDTAGRPSCRTTGGRTVYGGGGIYPDVVLDERGADPLWLARLREEDVPTRWIGGYVSANASAFPSVEALVRSPTLPAAALTEFRAFAARAGTPVPDGTEADAHLQRILTRGIARAKWGDAGFYRLVAVTDPQVREAAAQFPRAAQILGAGSRD